MSRRRRFLCSLVGLTIVILTVTFDANPASSSSEGPPAPAAVADHGTFCQFSGSHRLQWVQSTWAWVIEPLWSPFSQPTLDRSKQCAIGKSLLEMRMDGNLVLYDENWQLRWNTGTSRPDRPRGHRVTMQNDGNFVLYDVEANPIWATNTWGEPHSDWYALAVQADGNLVLYDTYPDPWNSNVWRPVWWTGTHH
jgi:hypothetical protein